MNVAKYILQVSLNYENATSLCYKFNEKTECLFTE